MLASEDEGELGKGSGERGVGEGEGVRSASGLVLGGAYGCTSEALAGGLGQSGSSTPAGSALGKGPRGRGVGEGEVLRDVLVEVGLCTSGEGGPAFQLALLGGAEIDGR
jgi:hypothetical protein